MSAARTVVVELGVVFAVEAAYAAAVRGAVERYAAIVGPPLGQAEARAVVASEATPGARALRLIADRVGGARAAVSRTRVERLVLEHLLGAVLYEAATGRAAGDVRGTGSIDRVVQRVGALERIDPGRSGDRALVARLPAPAALYLLARHGLTDAFDQVVAYGPGAEGVPPLAALVKEARARLGGPLRAVVAHAADARELRAAGFDVEECQYH